MQQRKLKLAKEDPWLAPVETEINDRYLRFRERLSLIESDDGSLVRFAN